MKHLTDETLNEYMDNELADRASVEKHLADCADCAARLAAFQALFTELDSLPDEHLTRPIAARLMLPLSHPAALPRWLTLTATLQAVLAVIAAIAAAPFVMEFVSPYLGILHLPSLSEIFFQVQSQWVAWLDALSQFQLPTLPEIPAVDISSLYSALALAGASILWLLGNGLLLRKQMK